MNGVELNYMACRDLDERLDYYTPVIITSDEVIESDPDMIKAFLRATKKGYEDAMADPDAAAEHSGLPRDGLRSRDAENFPGVSDG